jgi:hypothetical protein
MVNTPFNTQRAIRILLVPKNNADASAMMDEVEKAGSSVQIRRAETKGQFLELLHSFVPQLVVADYDFGLFPFINSVREKRPDVPFIIVSELELLQNAPRRGLNINVLKTDIARLPRWVDALNVAGLFGESRGDNLSQINSFLKATEALPRRHASDSKEKMVAASPESPTKHGPATDPLKKWTEELEQKMSDTTLLKMKPSRPDPLLSPKDSDYGIRL